MQPPAKGSHHQPRRNHPAAGSRCIACLGHSPARIKQVPKRLQTKQRHSLWSFAMRARGPGDFSSNAVRNLKWQTGADEPNQPAPRADRRTMEDIAKKRCRLIVIGYCATVQKALDLVVGCRISVAPSQARSVRDLRGAGLPSRLRRTLSTVMSINVSLHIQLGRLFLYFWPRSPWLPQSHDQLDLPLPSHLQVP